MAANWLLVRGRALGDPAAMRVLRRASRAHAEATARLGRAMLAASDSGASLRVIADEVGVSQETVRTTLARLRDER